jgi:hypothetical protein
MPRKLFSAPQLSDKMIKGLGKVLFPNLGIVGNGTNPVQLRDVPHLAHGSQLFDLLRAEVQTHGRSNLSSPIGHFSAYEEMSLQNLREAIVVRGRKRRLDSFPKRMK